MKDRTAESVTTDHDPDELLVPAGLLGPVYRIRNDADHLRGRWLRAMLWSVVVPILVMLVVVIAGTYSAPQTGRLGALDDPWVVLGVFVFAWIFQSAAGFVWTRRHADRLDRVPWASVDLDTRLDAQFELMSARKLRSQVGVLSFWMVVSLLALLVMGLLGEIPVLFAFVVATMLFSTATSFRVYQLRRRREARPDTASGSRA